MSEKTLNRDKIFKIYCESYYKLVAYLQVESYGCIYSNRIFFLHTM